LLARMFDEEFENFTVVAATVLTTEPGISSIRTST
jgi:hypothetical protein